MTTRDGDGYFGATTNDPAKFPKGILAQDPDITLLPGERGFLIERQFSAVALVSNFPVQDVITLPLTRGVWNIYFKVQASNQASFNTLNFLFLSQLSELQNDPFGFANNQNIASQVFYFAPSGSVVFGGASFLIGKKVSTTKNYYLRLQAQGYTSGQYAIYANVIAELQ